MAASLVRNALAISLRAETAKRLQSQSGLCFAREERVTAGEHQPQASVFDLALKGGRIARLRIVRRLLHECDDLRFLLVKDFLAADDIEREVLRRLRKPGGGICGMPT